MELVHEFTVPVGREEAWNVLLDVERMGPCMPGATVLDVRGDEFTGTVKVKVGPISMTYAGDAKFVEKDEANGRVVVDAAGKETRGSGTAKAKVTATLTPAADGLTSVRVVTDLAVTGRPAQFGRGMLQDVGGKLIGQFANRLAETLQQDTAAPEPAAPVDAAPADGADASSRPVPASPPLRPSAYATREQSDDAIDLLAVTGVSGAIQKYRVPLAVGTVGLVLVWILVRRRRHH
ncbi:MAG: SRPBCC family protein [Streptosporangiales bacterium]|nr:SRPBCC family protein [Streptosporangiales bacterium]MBO0889868.1 SRPBCC family protein [Acidothermales bacterium]